MWRQRVVSCLAGSGGDRITAKLLGLMRIQPLG